MDSRIELIRHVPSELLNEAVFIQQLVWDLDKYCRDLRSALMLHDFSHSNLVSCIREKKDGDLYGAWKAISARDSLSTIYKFGECLEAVWLQVHASPPIKAAVDTQQLKTAKNLFTAKFPAHQALRHTATHQLNTTLRDQNQSAAKGPVPGFVEIEGDGPGPGIIMRECFNGSVFTASHGGKVITFAMTKTSLDSLFAVRDATLKAFPCFPGHSDQIETPVD